MLRVTRSRLDFYLFSIITDTLPSSYPTFLASSRSPLFQDIIIELHLPRERFPEFTVLPIRNNFSANMSVL